MSKLTVDLRPECIHRAKVARDVCRILRDRGISIAADAAGRLRLRPMAKINPDVAAVVSRLKDSLIWYLTGPHWLDSVHPEAKGKSWKVWRGSHPLEADDVTPPAAGISLPAAGNLNTPAWVLPKQQQQQQSLLQEQKPSCTNSSKPAA